MLKFSRPYLNSYNFIKSVLITEKSSKLKEDMNKLTVVVPKNYSKDRIKSDFLRFFKVEVLKVNILNTKDKNVIFKGRKGVKPGCKKAIISLKSNDVLDYSIKE